jgi:tRNA 2-selenouridine synthase
LDNEQRAKVGTIYKRVSAFDAKMLGASLISHNISKHLQGYLKNFRPDTKIFVYCSRGGQRSGSFATILSAIGFRVYR